MRRVQHFLSKRKGEDVSRNHRVDTSQLAGESACLTVSSGWGRRFRLPTFVFRDVITD